MIWLNFHFLKIFCKNYIVKIFMVLKIFSQNKYRFLWNEDSDVVFNNESKNIIRNGFSGTGFGVSGQNTEIFICKNPNFGVIVQKTWAKGYYYF